MRNWMRFTVWVTLFFFFLSLAGQRFERVNDIIPIPLSESLYQDTYGFIWFGSVEGLFRYDGYDYKMYVHDPNDSTSIGGEDVNAIFEDSKGRMWIGLQGEGLQLFNRDTEQFTRVCLKGGGDSCFQRIIVYSIAEGASGTLYIGSNQGFFTCSGIGTKEVLIQQFTPSETDPYSISSSYVYDIIPDHPEGIWIGTLDGINLYTPEEARFFHHHNRDGFPDTQILDVEESPNGEIWICPRFTLYRIYTWNTETKEFEPIEQFKGDHLGDFRISFSPYDQSVWIGSRGVGVYRYNKGTGNATYYDPAESRMHGMATFSGLETIVDRYGNAWITGSNVLKFPSTYKPIHSIPGDSYRTLAVHADRDYIWFNGIQPMRWDRHGRELEFYWPEGIPNDIRKPDRPGKEVVRIYDYYPLGDDQLCILTTRNLFIWNTAQDTYTEYPFEYGGPFRDIVKGTSGKIWITTNQGTLLEFDPETGDYRRHADTPLNEVRNIRTITVDRDGIIWAGSSNLGVFCFDESTLAITHFRKDPDKASNSLSNNYVNHILAHSDGTIWVATRTGLDRIDPATRSVNKIGAEEGIMNAYIASIAEDLSGQVWFGTKNGLKRINPENGQIEHLNTSDGLINRVFTDQGAYCDKDGYLYFAGDQGVDYFHPDKLGNNHIPPDLYISRIRVNSQDYPLEVAPENMDILDLDYTENFLEIRLLAIHLTSPQSNTYKYRLENFQDDWISLGENRNITLTNLDPGRYVLYAKAANSDGVWSREKKLLEIIIAPPFWRTWWFYAFCILFITGIVYGISRYRISQVRKEESLKSEFNKRIAEIEMKALRAQMNPHFLFNSLNSVKALISQQKNREATLYLTRFGQLIRTVLNNSRKKLVRLQDDLAALELYLELEWMRFDERFDYSIHVGKGVNADFIEVPPLLMQPFVENAIWHGLMHKLEGRGKINIDIERKSNSIAICIEDNGIGREKAAQLHTRSSSKKESLGMKITEDRLSLLKEIYGAEARVEIEDLYDPENNPTGTRVTIIIPVQD